MPKLGLTMTAATLVEWRKQDGEWVEKGDPLFVLASEKSTLEIEAPASGALHVLIPAGERVPVSQPIALQIAVAEAIAAPQTRPGITTIRPSSPVARPGSPIVPHSSGSRITPASPKARTLTRRLGLELESIAAEEPGG
jgi:pyruvate/2-oxoglutarate dehydrogenase complex dihydrolipoamide acyltransferase (E2) component